MQPDRETIEDLISEAIADSIDMDWQPRHAVRCIMRDLEREGLAFVQVREPTPSERIDRNYKALVIRELRNIVPRRKPGVSHDFAFKMDGYSIEDLNRLINEALDFLECPDGGTTFIEPAKVECAS